MKKRKSDRELREMLLSHCRRAVNGEISFTELQKLCLDTLSQVRYRTSIEERALIETNAWLSGYNHALYELSQELKLACYDDPAKME